MSWRRAFLRATAKVFVAGVFVIIANHFHGWKEWQVVAFTVYGMVALEVAVWLVADERAHDKKGPSA